MSLLGRTQWQNYNRQSQGSEGDRPEETREPELEPCTAWAAGSDGTIKPGTMPTPQEDYSNRPPQVPIPIHSREEVSTQVKCIELQNESNTIQM